jgi:hypothetical protein
VGPTVLYCTVLYRPRPRAISLYGEANYTEECVGIEQTPLRRKVVQGGGEKKVPEVGHLCPPRPKQEAVPTRTGRKSYSTVLLAIQDTDSKTELRCATSRLNTEGLSTWAGTGQGWNKSS